METSMLKSVWSQVEPQFEPQVWSQVRQSNMDNFDKQIQILYRILDEFSIDRNLPLGQIIEQLNEKKFDITENGKILIDESTKFIEQLIQKLK